MGAGSVVGHAEERRPSIDNFRRNMASRKRRTGVCFRFRVRDAQSVSTHYSNRRRARISTMTTSRVASAVCFASHAICFSVGWATIPTASKDGPRNQVKSSTRGLLNTFERHRPKLSAKRSSRPAFASWSDEWTRNLPRSLTVSPEALSGLQNENRLSIEPAHDLGDRLQISHEQLHLPLAGGVVGRAEDR